MSRRRIALLVETSNAYARGLLTGIINYMRAHEHWSVEFPEQGRGELAADFLKQWRGDGLIARIETPQIARALRRLRMPIVDLSAGRFLPHVPWFETDDVQIARLALDHFRERGLQRLAYVGDDRFNWSRWRREAFLQLASEVGMSVDVLDVGTSGRSAALTSRRLVKWISRLKRPVGILTCYDLMGRMVLDACRETGMKVPGDAAVLGVDNDEFVCNLTTPPLSSVIPDAERTGYRAAEHLARLMDARCASDSKGERIAPLGISLRGSTDMLAVADPMLAESMRWIQQHAMEGIQVADVLRHIPMSRRVFEAKFREQFQRTPHDEIQRIRLERVRQLLASSDLSVGEIALRCGYRHAEYMTVAFKRWTSQTPRAFRQVLRGDVRPPPLPTRSRSTGGSRPAAGQRHKSR
jgi:LacI family transcriptional regulator